MIGKTRLIAIAAMAENRIIGKEGRLPWHCSADLKFFKRTTLGSPILFGRTTFEHLGKTLPGRENVVLSRTFPKGEDYRVVRTLSGLADLGLPKIYVCGGAEIYRQLFPHCDELLLTRIKGSHEGDVVLPPFEDGFEFAALLEEGEGYRIERHLRRVTA